MKKYPSILLSSLCVFLLTPHALAAPTPASPATAKETQSSISGTLYTTMDSKTLESIMKAEGYTSVTIDEEGDIIWKIEGLSAAVIIDEDGESLLFQITFSDSKATLQHINNWNQTKRYSRSYIADDDRIVLELDLSLKGGVGKARIIDFLKTSRVSLAAWSQEVVLAE